MRTPQSSLNARDAHLRLVQFDDEPAGVNRPIVILTSLQPGARVLVNMTPFPYKPEAFITCEVVQDTRAYVTRVRRVEIG